MASLVLPPRVTIQVCLWDQVAGRTRPLPEPGLVFGVRTFARHKNDYRLGPFFSGPDGRVVVTRDELEIAADAKLQTGLMDYVELGDSSAYVEIAHWSPAEVDGAVEGRRTWGVIGRERERWRSAEELIALLRAAPNARYRPLEPPFHPIRDEWDGSGGERSYEYVLYPNRAA